MRLRFPTILLLILFSLPASAQSQAPPKFPVAPVVNEAQQVTLGNGAVALMGPWKFRLGDAPEMSGAGAPLWAQPEFDDSGWQDYTIKKQGWPDSVLRLQSNFDPGWAGHGHPGVWGYGWYRIRVELTGRHGPLDLLIPEIDNASAVYWDGQRLGGYGDPGRRRAHFVRRPQLLAIPPALSAPGEHVLAVRTWALPLSVIRNSALGGGLRGAPLLAEPAIAQRIQSLQRRLLQALATLSGVIEVLPFYLIGIVSLLLFLYNRRHREYLWVALTLLLDVDVLFGAADGFSNSGWLTSTEFAIANALSAGAILFSLLAMQWLLELQDRRALGYANIAAGTLMWIAYFGIDFGRFGRPHASASFYSIFFNAAVAFEVLCVGCAVWMAVAGVRKMGREAWLMLSPNFVIAAQLLWAPLAWNFVSHRVWFVVNQILVVLIPISILAILIYRFVHQWREHQRLEKDYENARQVQHVLIPEALPVVPGFTLESEYRPAQQVGGDFFQIIEGAESSLLIVLGDETGHGLQAAMLVSLLVGAIRNQTESSLDPLAMLQTLNRRLIGRGHAQATCLALRIAADGAVTLANAGHLAPYLNGQEMAMEGALPLGIIEAADFSVMEFQLQSGDRLTLLTDGVVEAQNEKKELFGFARTAELLQQDRMAGEIAAVAQAFGQEDDITVVRLVRTI